MVAVQDAPCNPWTPIFCEDLSTYSPEVQNLANGDALEAATDLLWTLTGRRFGTCEVKTRPCREDCPGSTPYGWYQWMFPQTGTSWGYPWPTLVSGTWINLGCGACGNTCHCGVLHQFVLPYPVANIIEIRIDGAVLPTDAYRVDEHRYVVRTDGGQWPLCNDLSADDTEVGTWSVTAMYGVEVPRLGEFAVGELALEIAKRCAGEDCRLPLNVTEIQRQGVTKKFVDPNQVLMGGLTGLYLVDQFITSKNPNRLQGRAKVFDIDGQKARTVGL